MRRNYGSTAAVSSVILPATERDATVESTVETVEIFSSLQGEGPSLGTPAVFVRTRRCPLRCRWCDSLYAVDPQHPDYNTYTFRTPTEIIHQIRRLAGASIRQVVLTGGEPMLWQRQLAVVVWNLQGFKFEVETSGVVPPRDLSSQVAFNVSPKLRNSGNPVTPDVLEPYAELARKGTAIFKFVVTQSTIEQDLQEIEEMQKKLGIPGHSIYLMPEGVTQEVVLEGMRALADPCIQRGWNLTTRLQILLWGNRRGV